MAIVLALAAMLLMSVLGAAAILNTSAETVVAANFRTAHEGLYAADAASEAGMAALEALPDWDAVLSGATRSPFVDGRPGGSRTLADGSRLDLDQVVNMTNCRRVSTCSASDLRATTSQRPWGANNPVWRLFAYGPLFTLFPGHAIDSTLYVVVLVADDPSETDNDPTRDGDGPLNPGTGVLVLHTEAFGPRAGHQVIEATIERFPPGMARIRVLSWRSGR
jgi:hypothetical protein